MSPRSAQMVLRELCRSRGTLMAAGACRAEGRPPSRVTHSPFIEEFWAQDSQRAELHLLTTLTELTEVTKTCGTQKDPFESEMFLQVQGEKDPLSFGVVPLFLLCCEQQSSWWKWTVLGPNACVSGSPRGGPELKADARREEEDPPRCLGHLLPAETVPY